MFKPRDGSLPVAEAEGLHLRERNAFVSAGCRVRDIRVLRWNYGREFIGAEEAWADVASRRCRRWRRGGSSDTRRMYGG